MPPPPSNHRKQPSPPTGRPQQPQQQQRPQRRRVEKLHPPVSYFNPEDEVKPPTTTIRLSAASITPIAPSVRQSTVSDLDDSTRSSPVTADRPPLPPFPTHLQNPTGHSLKPTEAERYKQRYLNRRTLPAPARSTTFAPPATGRPRTQSLGSASASSASTTSTGEPQRSTTTAASHHRKRRPSNPNPTLPSIVERERDRPLPDLPLRPRRIPTTNLPSNSYPHVHFNTQTPTPTQTQTQTHTQTHAQPPKSAPHPAPSDPPRLANINIADDSRPSLTSPHAQPMSSSPTSTLVHSNGTSPLHEQQHSTPKTPSKNRMFHLNKNINKNLTKLFNRGRSASVGCDDTATVTPTTHEPEKRPTTPDKFSSLPAISTSDISRPIRRSITVHTPTIRPRFRHPGDLSAAAVKRVRRVTPLTEVDMDFKKEWRSSFMKERKVPVYHPPADSPYASHGR